MYSSSERVWHYLTPNEATRQPRSHIVIDVRTRQIKVPGGQAAVWRCAAAMFRKAPKGRRVKEWANCYERADQLWGDVSAFAGKRGRTVLWAHNLGLGTRVAEAFRLLPAAGWELVAHNLAQRGTWLVWHRDGATLCMVDSASVFAMGVGKLGGLFGMNYPDAPVDQADEVGWLAYTVRGAEILYTAIVAYLDWLDRDGMGNWQLTGAGQSWAAFRHLHLTHRMLVHADTEALAAERRAAWTGRCEAYWRGTMLRQVLHEWDLHAAYARIARDSVVPVRLVGQAPPKYPWRRVLGDPKVALLAEVTVRTERPLVPTLLGGRIAWPVGTFRTTLWTPELQLLVESGADVTTHRMWIYHAAPALKRWGAWILAQLTASDREVPAWQKAVYQQWVRSTIGRFAMQYSTWEAFAMLGEPNVERRTMIDEIDERTYELVQVGQSLFAQGDMVEWNNSMPMVTSYVMSALRVRMAHILAALPPQAALYCDTDSVMVTDQWLHHVQAVADSPIGDGLRLKRSWEGFTILGPRQITTGAKVRMAGLSGRAVRTGRREWIDEQWEGLEQALTHGRADRALIRTRSWAPKGKDHRRSGPPIGWTHPIRVHGDEHAL